MKTALIVYHKNVQQYPKEWITKFTQSILNQTVREFDLFELNYGGGEKKIFENSLFFNEKMPTFAHGMNFLISKGFEEGYDVIFNTNCDDFYRTDRIEQQCKYLKMGYDVVSSNFSLIKDDIVTHTHFFDKMNIKQELEKNHNIICHPVVAFSKKFWGNNRYIPGEIPFEDIKLWQRALKSGNGFIISPEILCYHRLHDNSVGHKLKEE